MRGERRHFERRGAVSERFIPACAGNAYVPESQINAIAVHPRMRGERIFCKLILPIKHGSSPHARGTHLSRNHARIPSRFIPACAGNAVTDCVFCRVVTVHPRMRGERMRTWLKSTDKTGSSPHARGTQTDSPCNRCNSRFIPACAGNAGPSYSGGGDAAVHPRMRGERKPAPNHLPPQNGSSPHARGTQQPPETAVIDDRFIPACAGNACGHLRNGRYQAVHPRMRGERADPPVIVPDRGGSSPHARGTHVASNSTRAGRRFIPACAGNASAAG